MLLISYLLQDIISGRFRTDLAFISVSYAFLFVDWGVCWALNLVNSLYIPIDEHLYSKTQKRVNSD